MLRIGQNQFPIPAWLRVAVPFAFLIYAAAPLFPQGFASSGASSGNYLVFISPIAIASIAGLLMIDLLHRSTVRWFVLPAVWLVSWAAASITVSLIKAGIGWGMKVLLLGAFVAAGSRPDTVGPFRTILIAVTFLLPLVLGLAAALAFTLGSRLLAGQGVFSRETLRDFWPNLGGAVVWMVLALGGSAAVRFGFDHFRGSQAEIPSWLSLTAAISAALAATALQVLLAHRRAAREAGECRPFRTWTALVMCLAVLLYEPFAFGRPGMIAFYDYIRPAMRLVGILPTPKLDVAGYRIDVPFQERGTSIGRSMPGDQPSDVSVSLPREYGLTAPTDGSVRVTIYRRDAPTLGFGDFRKERSKKLDDIQAGDPGRDALLHENARFTALSIRLPELQGVDVTMMGFDAAIPSDVAERALRRFLRERVHKID